MRRLGSPAPAYIAISKTLRNKKRRASTRAPVEVQFETSPEQAIVLRRYTPGVIMALLVALPFPRYLSHRPSQAGIISQSDWKQSKLNAVNLVFLHEKIERSKRLYYD